MNLRRVIAFAFVLLLAMGVLHAAASPASDANDYAAADAQILQEIHEHSEAMENLEHLSDSIGARLTGSPQLKQANEWTAEMFRKYGLTNVHLEPWTIAHSWTRGTAHARIVKPAEHPLTIAAAGWSPGTAGTLHAPVVYFDAKKKEEFEKFRGKLKGAVVIFQEPTSLSPPKPEDSRGEYVRAMQAPPPMGPLPPLVEWLGIRDVVDAPPGVVELDVTSAVRNPWGIVHGGVTACLVDMIEQRIAAIDVRQEVHDRYVREVDAEHEQMIWTHPGMTTYYRNKQGRVFSAMPWRFVDYWRMTHNADLSQYRLTKA